MKTVKVLLAVLMFICINGYSQKIYIRGGGGAALSTSADDIENLISYNTGYYNMSTKLKGVGTGFPFVVAAGYNLSNYFSVELGINYFYGLQLQRTLSNIFMGGDTYSDYETKWHGQMFCITPAFVMSVPLNKFRPYSRLGMLFGVMNNIIRNNHNQNHYEAIEIQSRIKEYGGIAIGAQAAVGTNFAINDLISLFAEIQLNGISYSPSHGKYTQYMVNGVEKLDTRTVKENSWDYKKELTFPNDIPDDQPDEQLSTNYHFNNVGLLIGIKLNL